MKNALRVFVLALVTVAFSGIGFAQEKKPAPTTPAAPATEKKTEKSMEKAGDEKKDEKAAKKSKTKQTKKSTAKSKDKTEENKGEGTEKKTK